MKRLFFSKSFLKRYLVLLLIVLVIRSSIYILSFWLDLRYQFTDSVPGIVYLIVKNRTPSKGDFAAFWPPENNEYGHICFIKYVKGVSGDYFQKKGTRFYINGEYYGEIKKYSLKNTPLLPSEDGLILKDHYFMWSPHKDSYDSRYKDIGTIASDRIIGTAYRLF